MKYDIIVSDPPYFYNARKNKNTRFGGGAYQQYPMMKTPEICALPVKEIAEKDSLLFLWVTWPRLPDGLDVMKAWGFKYVTLGFDWVKLNKSGVGYFFGTGHYAKSNTEFCLLGRRGKFLKPESNKVSSLVVTPLREHSRKPDEVRYRIDEMYPHLTKLEMFARESPTGWDVIGNEIDGKDIRESLWQLANKN